ncbi:flagellar protein FlgN [Bacillus sp. ISL-51]|uniref:flagellar protein FlgN n=1 Tax=Bacteria TaxID=2 RepID=UPI001BEC02C6|nr:MULTISPECIES: flagellar protein FlgN [Bacteria]MBT2572868.1 flagellar protein FlgN [Bacillus sp. ISL-51]MBT2635407.1 flagellar protein FlgN [Bacillus sp. ISL-26]MBT2713341.1 flagellar protein FlgN [Pseudomonas sp. ISL-88]
MSAKPIIEQLKRLCVLHEHLLTLSEEKTEALKTGKTKELSNILTKEQKYIQAIGQTEEERIKLTSQFLSRGEGNTIAACIAKTSGSEKQELEGLFQSLSALLDRLKEVNEMNKQLTIQALQFISTAFDMIMPGEKENMNYKEPQAARQPVSRLTLFDSKA